jgi:hypothetical protein
MINLKDEFIMSWKKLIRIAEDNPDLSLEDVIGIAAGVRDMKKDAVMEYEPTPKFKVGERVYCARNSGDNDFVINAPQHIKNTQVINGRVIYRFKGNLDCYEESELFVTKEEVLAAIKQLLEQR